MSVSIPPYLLTVVTPRAKSCIELVLTNLSREFENRCDEVRNLEVYFARQEIASVMYGHHLVQRKAGAYQAAQDIIELNGYKLAQTFVL